MNEIIFRKKENAFFKRGKKNRPSLFCLLLAFTLIIGGCAAPTKQNENSSSASQPSSQEDSQKDAQDASSQEDSQKDAQEEPSSQEDSQKDAQEEPSSQEDSQEENFDFSRPLALKAPQPAAGETPRILFVGNSHTFTNDLPSIFSQLAAAMGHECDVQELTEGSYTLTQFADPQDEVGSVLNQKLTEENWDFVMIQENTNDAFSTPEETMLPAAKTLDEKIRGAGGQTAILMTWSPKDGASIFSLTDVQTILSQNTIQVSEELDSLLVPGGVAFMRCLEQYPQIELWNEDGMHPSLAGSYLTACTAYAVIFQQSPEGCSYTADLDAETAAQLQSLAAGFLHAQP